MRGLAMAIALTVGGVAVAHADDTCTTRASAKKLAGAAQTSFMTKCQKDATATCNSNATAKKLSGAARTSYTKKCVSDAVGG